MDELKKTDKINSLPEKNNEKPKTKAKDFKLENNSPSQIISPTSIQFPLWFSISETAKLGGVTTKTIRRAISGKQLTYKIVKNRYLIDWQTVLNFLQSNKKLKNKLDQKGIGQFIEKWK